MNADDLRRFARRDWAAIENEKARYWAEHKRAMSPAEAIALGDQLRRHAQAVQPDWPDESERRADLETHAAVARALRAIANASR